MSPSTIPVIVLIVRRCSGVLSRRYDMERLMY